MDTICSQRCTLPAVAISGHRHVPGVTNIVLDHDLAARLALQHLQNLGHERIALMKGQDFSTHTETRWQAVLSVAQQLGIAVNEKLMVQLEIDSPFPEVGLAVTRKLLDRTEPFTALLRSTMFRPWEPSARSAKLASASQKTFGSWLR